MYGDGMELLEILDLKPYTESGLEGLGLKINQKEERRRVHGYRHITLEHEPTVESNREERDHSCGCLLLMCLFFIRRGT
jgi:hypothetical protein